MADCIVKPVIKIVKCSKCGALYKPEKIKENGRYENCPICGFCFNDAKNHIPLWKYKLIRFKREVLNL